MEIPKNSASTYRIRRGYLIQCLARLLRNDIQGDVSIMIGRQKEEGRSLTYEPQVNHIQDVQSFDQLKENIKG